MKHARNIFSLFLAIIFLIPAAGLYFTRHSCLKSGNTQIVFDNNYSCCVEETQMQCSTESEAESTCCIPKAENPLIIKESSEDCCSNEGEYLKTDIKYISPEKTKLPQIEILITIASLPGHFHSFPESGSSVEEYSHSPPFTISSRHILLQHGVLLV